MMRLRQTILFVLAKNELRINIFQNAELSHQHHPEFRLVTGNTEAVYNKISSSHPQLLHLHLNQITIRLWGAKEFAITDKQPGIVIQEW